MTTLIIRIEEGASASKIASAMRQIKGVEKVTMKKEKPFENIPGLPYTREERVASVRRGMEDYRAGRLVTTDELRKNMETW